MVIPLNARPSAFWTANASVSKRHLNKRNKEVIFVRRCVMALVAFLLMALGTVGGSRYQAARGHIRVLVGTLRVPMTVQAGDSLWNLAKRYGDPNVYILDRVDVLARANRMPATASLMPGQRIVILVSNPVEVARLQQNLAKN